jgi:hypothetical protein
MYKFLKYVSTYVIQLLINIFFKKKIIVFCSFLQFFNVDRLLVYLYIADYKDKISTVFNSWNSGRISSFYQEEGKKMRSKMEYVFFCIWMTKLYL